jgi:hypothetical protein
MSHLHRGRRRAAWKAQNAVIAAGGSEEEARAARAAIVAREAPKALAETPAAAVAPKRKAKRKAKRTKRR